MAGTGPASLVPPARPPPSPAPQDTAITGRQTLAPQAVPPKPPLITQTEKEAIFHPVDWRSVGRPDVTIQDTGRITWHQPLAPQAVPPQSHHRVMTEVDQQEILDAINAETDKLAILNAINNLSNSLKVT